MRYSDDLNDPLDDIFGRVGTPEERAAVRPLPQPEKAQAAGHWESCPKCGGSGRYGRASRHGSQCFACKGAGGRRYKASPEARAVARGKAAARRASRAAEEATERAKEAAAWRSENPEAAAWLAANCSDFAGSLRDALEKWGHLTDNQLAAVHRSIERDAERAREAAERAAAAPAVAPEGVNRLKEAFDHAAEYARSRGRGLKMPRITLGTTVISPAGTTSRNPGALYVKSGGTYLGKIVEGHFHASRECSPEDTARVLAFIADPKAAAIAYGLETGVCCICNAELTNKVSVERGIGPICAEKFGW